MSDEKRVKRILLVGRDPDGLSDAQRAELAKVFGRFEAVRIDPVSCEDHDRICREQGNPPVVSVGPEYVGVGFFALRRGVPHFIFYYPDENDLERLVYKHKEENSSEIPK